MRPLLTNVIFNLNYGVTYLLLDKKIGKQGKKYMDVLFSPNRQDEGFEAALFSYFFILEQVGLEYLKVEYDVRQQWTHQLRCSCLKRHLLIALAWLARHRKFSHKYF